MFKDLEEYYNSNSYYRYSEQEVDLLVGQIISQETTNLLKVVRRDYGSWEEQLIIIENYLIAQLRELVEQVVTDVDNVSPIGRYQIILAIASTKPEDEVKKVLKRYGKRLNTSLNPHDYQDRAKLIAKVMHRSAMIYSLQWADRVIEESKIVNHKIDPNNRDIIRAHYESILLVHDTLRMYLNQVEHAELVSQQFEDKDILAKEMPSVEIFSELVGATIELLKNEGIFVPVVIETLKDQENPYQLIVYTKDLLILYDLLQEYGKKLTEQKIRDRVAEEVRNDDLMDRFNNWLVYMAELASKKEEFATPFAKKIKEAIKKGLGTGKILQALQTRVVSLSAAQKERVQYIVAQSLLEEANQIAGLSVGSWFLQLSTNYEMTGNIDLTELLSYLKKSGYLAQDPTERELVQVKELASIVQLIRSLRV